RLIEIVKTVPIFVQVRGVFCGVWPIQEFGGRPISEVESPVASNQYVITNKSWVFCCSFEWVGSLVAVYESRPAWLRASFATTRPCHRRSIDLRLAALPPVTIRLADGRFGKSPPGSLGSTVIRLKTTLRNRETASAWLPDRARYSQHRMWRVPDIP